MKTRRLVGFSLLVVVLWTGLGWAEQPRYGGTLRIAWPGDPAFFNANQGPAQGAPSAWLSEVMAFGAPQGLRRLTCRRPGPGWTNSSER